LRSNSPKHSGISEKPNRPAFTASGDYAFVCVAAFGNVAEVFPFSDAGSRLKLRHEVRYLYNRSRTSGFNGRHPHREKRHRRQKAKLYIKTQIYNLDVKIE
jgi:hypothetical protein